MLPIWKFLTPICARFPCISRTQPNRNFASVIDRLTKRPRPAPLSTGWNPLSNLDLAAEIIQIAPPGLVPFTICGEKFEESGATAVEEAGFTLAAAVDFMAEMQSRKIKIDQAAASVTVWLCDWLQLFL